MVWYYGAFLTTHDQHGFSYHVGLGNPLIKREMDLQCKIKDLKMEKSRYSEKIYEIQDNIRVKYPNQMAQSLIKTDFYINTGNIFNPLITLVVIERVSANERMILFFSFAIFA